MSRYVPVSEVFGPATEYITSPQLLSRVAGAVFVFCPGDCPFKSEPSPTSADTCREVTGYTVGCQEVGMCSIRGGSQGMYIIHSLPKKK